MSNKSNVVGKNTVLGAMSEWLACVEANISGLDTEAGQSRRTMVLAMKADVDALMEKRYADISDSAYVLVETLR